MNRFVPSCFLLALCWAFLLATCAFADSDASYLGAASCASSACHGSEKPRNTNNVLQNEYVTWFRHGVHSKAWKVLLEKEAKKMGEHLGIAHPEKDPQCLRCHGTYTSAQMKKGERFQMDDGVSCERCHGASSNWIETHTQTNVDRNELITQGLRDIYPLDKRADLCLECHYGTDNQYVDHRLIGAGHPRLSFELDTFSMLQPRHWKIDEDYQKRKGPYYSTKSWIIGQLSLSLATLEALESPIRSKKGVWPELTLFNCYTCHHNLQKNEWKQRNYEGRPGELVLNTAALQMVAIAAQSLNLKEQKQLHNRLVDLQKLYGEGKAATTIKQIRSQLKGYMQTILGWTPNDKERRNIVKTLLKNASKTGHFHYEEAEQLAMAIASVLADGTQSEKEKSQLNKLMDTLENSENFDSNSFQKRASAFLASY